MVREHGERGEFVQTVALEDVLETFESVRGPAVLSADVADRLECSRETARRKLAELYERGQLDRRKVARRVVYWRPEHAPQEAVSRSATVADRTGGTEEGQPEPGEGAPAVGAVDRDRLGEAVPGNGERLEARVGAILRMYAYLREHGTAEKDDLLELVDVEAVGYASPDSVWANMVKGRDTLRALPGVETPPPGRTEWRYTAEDDGSGSELSGVYDPTEEFLQ